jgi:hypothetical protein
MKKYQHLPALSRREKQQITGGIVFQSTTCWGYEPGFGSFSITVDYRRCNPSLCCTMVPNAWGYTCGGMFAEVLEC